MKNLSYSSVAASLVGVHLGGGTIISTCEYGYTYGAWGIFYSLGIVLGIMILSFIYKERNLNTSSEIFKQEYKSVFLHKLSSVLSITSLSVILVAQFLALRNIVEPFNDKIFWPLSVITIIYSILGGLVIVAKFNKIQVGVIALIFIATLISLKLSVFSTMNFNNDIFPNNMPTLSNIFIPMMFCFVEQDVLQKFFLARNVKSARIGGVIAAIVLLCLSCIPLYIGILAKSLNFQNDQGSLLVNFIFHYTKYGYLVLIAIALAIITTIDSIICAITSNIKYDFECQNNKLFMFMLIVIVVLLSLYVSDIIFIFVFAYKITIYTLFSAMVFVVKSPKYAYLCFAIGCLGFVLSCVFKNDLTLIAVLVIQILLFTIFKKSLKYKKI